ncbi:hypothetical protein O3G_MSEX013289 [Manduca sexta]|uniref:BTB domain-containing protein n=1 Tax=Manduca sexta TaxID=7130 RepID=A0A922CYA1_MANSE|nr:hypothetical protein O3G_MSEX013289 [Manduca sexta]
MPIQKDLPNRHDIGGTYTNETPDLWFYYTTSMCPKSFLLLNLFVCHRKTGSFSVGISNSNQFTMTDNICTLPNNLTWYNFRSAQNDETHYIKTFHFPMENFKTDVEVDTTTIVIPLNIRVEPPFSLNSDVLKTIKLEHNESNCFIQQEKTDFIIKSDSGKEYPVHKILVASHSSVLRQLMKDKIMLCLDINDNTVELLLQYIYTGTIKNIGDQNVLDLLETVHKFQLKPLLILIDHLIEKELTVNNAVQMALVAKKYGLHELKSKVYDYIKNNPDVMNSEGWKHLNDVELTKSIFQYVLTNKI